jgi:hypothetical protein
LAVRDEMVNEIRPKTPISADWVLKRIQEGKRVRLNNAVIEGDLDLNKLDLPIETVERTEFELSILKLQTEYKIVYSSIKITYSEFKYRADFSNTKFISDVDFNFVLFAEGGAEFSGASFSGGARFAGVNFGRDAFFKGVNFGRDAWFDGAIFRESARFDGANFRRYAFFESVNFGWDTRFDGANFRKGAWFIANFRGDASFNRASFSKDTRFEGTSFRAKTWFYGASFSEEANFNRVSFSGPAMFEEASFSGYAMFEEASFSGYASFNRASFSGGARFAGASFRADTWFDGASFSESAGFGKAGFSGSAWFRRANFIGYAGLDGTKFEGDVLTFRDAIFIHPQSQEETCRRAKNVLEKNGNRDEAGYHFYREMEGKRKQKESTYQYFDYEALLFCNEPNATPKKLTDLFNYLRYNILDYLFIQIIFGYGVHPLRLWACWWIVVGLFTIFYWIGGGINNLTTNQPLNFLDCLWFSITVAVTPGFAGYKPSPGFYQVLAGLEAIFGTFMWAAFVTTFAKKYMR